MKKRKLTDEVIKKFDIKYDPQTKCIVFPVRDELGKLVEEFSLLVIPNPIKSKRIGPEDIVSLGEFFKGEKLSWLDHNKFYSSFYLILFLFI